MQLTTEGRTARAVAPHYTQDQIVTQAFSPSAGATIRRCAAGSARTQLLTRRELLKRGERRARHAPELPRVARTQGETMVVGHNRDAPDVAPAESVERTHDPAAIEIGERIADRPVAVLIERLRQLQHE